MYDSTQPGELVQILGPQHLRLESGPLLQLVLPEPTVPPADHVEPFPEGLFGRTYEAHCSFQGAYPTWELVYAPVLLGLLVLLVALLLSTLIAVLAWKRRQLAEGVRKMALCTEALERAERNKSETVANLSHELRTPIIGMIGMIDVVLESALEEWQRADLRDASACAGETVHLINRVLDLAKLQAGRLQLEAVPCCLPRIAHDAIALAAQDASSKGLIVTCHVDPSVPEVLMGDPTRLAQVVGELTAHAVSSTLSGHVAFHLWCIAPRPHTPRPHTPPAPPSSDYATATPSHTPHSCHSSQASRAPPAPPPASAWHQLAACVRRFPPPTRLACTPQPLAASQGGGAGRGEREGGRGVGGRKSKRRWGVGEGWGGRGGVSEGAEHRGGVAGVWGNGMGATSLVEAQGVLQQGRHGASTRIARTGDAAPTGNASSSVKGRGGGGRLEREVAAWVEGACRARGEGEWMVVMACEDTSGGIPPEEMQWVLDPDGHSPHPPQASAAAAAAAATTAAAGAAAGATTAAAGAAAAATTAAAAAGDGDGAAGAGAGGGWGGDRGSRKKRQSVVQPRARGTAAPLSDDQQAAARPPWTPYPVRFLLSTSLVAEMRGTMAVLSDAATGTTILLALPMGGVGSARSRGGAEGDGDEEGLVAAVAAGQQVAGSCGLGGCTPCDAAAAVEPAALQHASRGRSLSLLTESMGASVRGGMAATENAEAAVRGVIAGQWVVVVDDNAVNRMVARRMLQGYGAHVLLLQSGEDALHALSTRAPSPPLHLLLLDLHMPPGIDGFETARQIRGMERGQQVPSVEGPTEAAGLENQGTEVGRRRKGLCIIALTADLDVGVKKACLEAGMDGAVRKPIVAHELLAALTGAGFGVVAPTEQHLLCHSQSL
ncbi:hypothetical protein CLOM_g20863 [Closterium sp. NIES-68]|nr:hypothetical protein CLOM_g20863 [Closterium sp. NIES-68]GJP68518.1 hypothetical protein CLOP_g25212 [Closterium sp. NIES-67]